MRLRAGVEIKADLGREFFTTLTVAEALAGFRPGRRTQAEPVPLAGALHRVPAGPVTAPHALPGFARSTVDGYAVRAADTYGASEGLPMVTLASSNVGSLGGLVALRDGLCHLAGSHLLDPASGEYTLPYLDRVLAPRGGAEVSVVRLVHRDQGLMVAPGNPLGLTGIGDLTRAGVRYVNRQRGAGTRVQLDFELGRLGVSPDDVGGYAREEPTHLAVAAAVAAGRADAGLGIMAAARAFGLGFVPVTQEPYDLVVAADAMDSPLLAPLWSLLRSDRFQVAVTELGGYTTKEMGRRIR